LMVSAASAAEARNSVAAAQASFDQTVRFMSRFLPKSLMFGGDYYRPLSPYWRSSRAGEAHLSHQGIDP